MNEALLRAVNPVVLFVDDDIIPHDNLVASHRVYYREDSVVAVAGQVLQPGQEPVEPPPGNRGSGLWRDLSFRFNTTQQTDVSNCMAGNLSVRRECALAIGGFDESFVGVAYRFETEFCRRLARGGGRIVYSPKASIQHLQAACGGTRSRGSHLTSIGPEHSVGAYYFAMRQGRPVEVASFVVQRLFREVRTRFHITHPWWIPVKLIGEIRGLAWAAKLARQGPRYVNDSGNGESIL